MPFDKRVDPVCLKGKIGFLHRYRSYPLVLTKHARCLTHFPLSCGKLLCFLPVCFVFLFNRF